MSGIDPSSRPAGSSGADDPAAADWQARLEAVNEGPGAPSALRRHTEFFDADKDGKLTVKEVRKGLQRLGMDWTESVFASTLNGALLAPPTRERLFAFTIDLNDIEKARHVGDTGIFDEKGRFVPAKFDEMFARFDKDRDGRLTATEVNHLVDVNTAGMSSLSRGKFSAQAEFDLLMKICGYEGAGGERYVTKERMLRFYDGKLFDDLAAEVKAFGGVVRHPVHSDPAFGASGPLPEVARRSAGPAAGSAAGAAFGDALLAGGDAAARDAAATAVLGGMMAVCPYAGAAGAAGPR